MPVEPWSDFNSDSVLFILDADHDVEEALLQGWLKENIQSKEFSGVIHQVIVPIAHDPENIPTTDLEKSLSVSEDTLLVPLRVVWKTSLDRTSDKPRFRDLLAGNPRRPNARKAKRLLNNDPSRAICVAGKPATLEDLRRDYDARQKNAAVDKNLAEYIAGQANLALEVAERRLRGSRYKVPRQVAKQIRASDRFKHGLERIAQETGESESQLRERALPIFKELLSIPHNFWQDVMASFNRKVISLGYENELVLDHENLFRYKQIVREHPSAVLWTHKTHMDGLTIQSVLFENDFPTPHTMGGINMAFAGLGFLARRSGAIFIRRSFQDNPLYKLVLHNYLSYLLEKRFPLTWSFEGTRSRVGKLMPPRYGMLKYVMEAMADSSADDLHIIPVAINYDMINDVKDYAAEQAGAIKRPESLSWFISYLRRFRQPLGRIYVDFGEPVVVNKTTISSDPLALERTAFKVGVEANRVTPITLTSLMAMSLLGAAPRAQTIEELRGGMQSLRDWASHRNVKFTSDFDDNNVRHMRELVDSMVNAELINRYDEGPETVYAVAADQHMLASYYRNTIVHHFVAKAIAELSLVHAGAHPENALVEFWSEANRLRDMFKFEFFYSPSEEFNSDIREELKYFVADWEDRLDREENFSTTMLREMTPLVAHAALRPYIEAYRIVADVFASIDAKQTLDVKSAVSASFKYGRQAYLQRRISSKASIGKILFQNGHKLLDNYGLVAVDSEGLLERRKLASKGFRVLAHRLEHIRALAMPNDLD